MPDRINGTKVCPFRVSERRLADSSSHHPQQDSWTGEHISQSSRKLRLGLEAGRDILCGGVTRSVAWAQPLHLADTCIHVELASHFE